MLYNKNGKYTKNGLRKNCLRSVFHGKLALVMPHKAEWAVVASEVTVNVSIGFTVLLSGISFILMSSAYNNGSTGNTCLLPN